MEKNIFLKIINKEIPANIVYEDNTSMAFLDINPNTKGHTLVIPKKSSKNLYDINDDDLSDVIKVVKKVALAQQKALGAKGVNISMNNEEIAGQEVFHSHIHVIPRYVENDYILGKHIEVSKEEMEEICEKLRRELEN